MLSKFLLTSFVSAGLLISTCGAMDLKEVTSLTLSVKKLEKGYNLGRKEEPLELKDGTKWLVKNNSSWNYDPNLYGLDQKQKFNGTYNPDKKIFYFEHSIPGYGFLQKWNEEKKLYEDDLENPMIGTDFFNFSVKQIIEDKAIILKEEKKPQQYIKFGNMDVPFVWDSVTQKMVLDFSSVPELANMINTQLNPVQKEKTSVLQIEDKKTDLKIEEIKKDAVIESNNLPNLELINRSKQEEKVITSLSLSLDELQTGFENGNLVLQDGSKWTVTNGNSWSQPCFTCGILFKIDGYYDQSEDKFHFSYSDSPHYSRKWNEEKQIWEIDYENLMPRFDFFNLIVKRSK